MSNTLEGIPVEGHEDGTPQGDPMDGSALDGVPVAAPIDMSEIAVNSQFGVPIEGVPVNTDVEQTVEGQPQQAAQETDRPWGPSDLPDHYSSPEDAYGAARYFQSEYSKAQSQIQEDARLLNEYKDIQPIADAILNDPDILSVVANHLNGSSSTGQSLVNPPVPAEGAGQQQAQATPLQMPKAPIKPSNVDMYSEEHSKWQEDYNRYLDDKAIYQQNMLDQKFSQIDGMVKAMESDRARVAQETQVRQMRERAVLESQHKHGLSRQDAEKFVSELESGSLANDFGFLVNAWKTNQAPNPEKVTQAAAVSAARERASHNRTQLAATQSGGQTTVVRNPVEAIGDAMVDLYGSKNNEWI